MEQPQHTVAARSAHIDSNTRVEVPACGAKECSCDPEGVVALPCQAPQHQQMPPPFTTAALIAADGFQRLVSFDAVEIIVRQ
jgi:hypothetical protein